MLQVLEAIYLGKATPSSGGGTSGADTSLSNLTDAGKIQAAHLAMPSNVYDELVVGSDGDSYTAPADGYYVLSLRMNTGSSIGFDAEKLYSRCTSVYAGQMCRCFIPARKGMTVSLNYGSISGDQSNNSLVFIYAVGSESEHTPQP